MVADWLDISSVEYDSHCGDDGNNTIEEALDGTDQWAHDDHDGEEHWFILDLGVTYTITKVKGRSSTNYDPDSVSIYVSDSKESWGTAVATGISSWLDETNWVEEATVEKDGRYVKVLVVGHESSGFVHWGIYTDKMFDVYGELSEASPNYTSFETPIGTPTGFSWKSGQLNVDSGMKATSATPTTWEWGVISSSISCFYPSGDELSWSWVSGSCGA